MKKISVDALVIGAGFAGLYMLLKLRDRGLNVQVLEAAGDVGGTWYWNRYPGARCDVISVEYCYSFSKELQEEFKWPERYSGQPDILKYIQYTTEKFDLRKNIQFNTKVTDAIYNEDTQLWQVKTEEGQVFETTYFIMGTGCLSVPKEPDFKGIDSFNGEFYLTGKWPHNEVSFEGKRVAVIGTGSSGVQVIPEIAKKATHLTVLQRTPSYSIPGKNFPLDDTYLQDIYKRYDEIRHKAKTGTRGVGLTNVQGTGKSIKEFSREEAFKMMAETIEKGTSTLSSLFNDVKNDPEADQIIREFLYEMLDKIVKDPQTANLLKPNYPLLSKRYSLGLEYLETYNRDNVTLVDVLNDPIEEITPKGVKTKNTEYEFDMIVCATGFDGMTGAISKINIEGKNAVKLKSKWAAGPRAYLGLMSNGYPNMFTITGPGSPSILANAVMSIEQHVEWIDQCIQHMQTNNIAALEPKLEEENKWVQHVTDIAEPFFISKGNSWYLGGNIPGKPRVFMPYIGGLGAYTDICNTIAATGYQTFSKKTALMQTHK